MTIAMKRALLLVCALATTADARPEDALATPPSPTLERAIKLYDRKDFLSASIELQKVLAGETGDDPANLQRATFFAGKTAYQLGFLAFAWSRFAALAEQPESPYFLPTAKWLGAILRVVPAPSVRGTLFRYRGKALLDDPELASVRDELAYQLGRELAARDAPIDEVLGALSRVDATSAIGPAAALERGRVKLRAKDLAGGIADAMTAPGNEAARLIASWTHLHGAPARAVAPLAQLPGAYARYQHARALLDARPELPGLARISIEAFDAVMLPAACRARWPDDIKPLARQVIGAARPLVAELLGIEDPGDLFLRLRRLREGAAMPGSDVVIAALADPTMQDRLAWHAEITHEIALHERADRTWRTTQAAAEVLEDLTLLQAIEANDIGAHAKQRLALLARDLDALAVVLAEASPAFALSAGPDVELGQGLVVTSDLCTGGGTAPLAGVVRPTRGCAGCSTRDAGPSFLVLAVLGFARIRRRARPRPPARGRELHHDHEDHGQG